MKLRALYDNDNCKQKRKNYKDLKNYFLYEISFSKKSKKEFLNSNIKCSRVWLLFASNDKDNWECLQVGHSKNNVQSEITDVIEIIKTSTNSINLEDYDYTNSTFYEKVCPKVEKVNYRTKLYTKIGSEYNYFRICFLDVDKYLGTKSNNVNTSDMERIIEISKNQYAEAKIAYQTLAVYWRKYSSGIDGQTIAYIAKHPSEF